MRQTQVYMRIYAVSQDEQNEKLTEMSYSYHRDAHGDTTINQSHHLRCVMADDDNP